MKFDDKFLNFWNWFINSKILWHFYSLNLESLCDAQFSELIFYKIQKFS